MFVIATLFRKVQTVIDLVRPFSEKHRFRTPSDNQHVKGSQPLVKPAGEHFHLFFFITLGEPDSRNISLSDMLILRVAW